MNAVNVKFDKGFEKIPLKRPFVKLTDGELLSVVEFQTGVPATVID